MDQVTTSVFPAHAGMSPRGKRGAWQVQRFPRPRGDEPHPKSTELEGTMVFPAHAGMSPVAKPVAAGAISFPRPRGDEPNDSSLATVAKPFSPPTRG